MLTDLLSVSFSEIFHSLKYFSLFYSLKTAIVFSLPITL